MMVMVCKTKMYKSKLMSRLVKSLMLWSMEVGMKRSKEMMVVARLNHTLTHTHAERKG